MVNNKTEHVYYISEVPSSMYRGGEKSLSLEEINFATRVFSNILKEKCNDRFAFSICRCNKHNRKYYVGIISISENSFVSFLTVESGYTIIFLKLLVKDLDGIQSALDFLKFTKNTPMLNNNAEAERLSEILRVFEELKSRFIDSALQDIHLNLKLLI